MPLIRSANHRRPYIVRDMSGLMHYRSVPESASMPYNLHRGSIDIISMSMVDPLSRAQNHVTYNDQLRSVRYSSPVYSLTSCVSGSTTFYVLLVLAFNHHLGLT